MSKQRDFQLHALMSLIGGFAGAYSLLRCHDNFGAAQTANLIYMLEMLFGGNAQQFLLRLLGLFFYMVGIESYVVVAHKTHWDPEKWVLVTEMICLILAGLLPLTSNLFVCLYPIFFMLAAQWSVFHGACGYNASTIFSSNNVKQFSLAIGEYCFDHKPEQKEKAQFFGLTLLFYHIGVAAVILCYPLANHFSIWFAFIPLLFAAWIILRPAEAGSRHNIAFHSHRVAKNTGR
ncbi:MAG: YoaK family protein [Clostridia bacterium]|nr:YoaK family protein [Clostridia bacterium]